MSEDAPYTREEIARLRDARPERGRWCERCNARVPAFADLPASEEARLRERIASGGMIAVMREVISRTGCSLQWAQIWAQHLIPHPARVVTPCPHCGQPLRNPRARQCRFCHRRWFDQPLPSDRD